jgi:hypothetical protein
MKNRLKLSAISLVAASVIFTGCGSSSSDDSSANNTNANTGYFIDSEVIGVSYTTSSDLNGTTDDQGRFQYHTGDTVTFSLGQLVLGEVEPDTDGLITPQLLVVGDNSTPSTEHQEKITLKLQTLQSLDSDGNATNGITIDSSVLSKLSKLSKKSHFKDINESYLLELETEHDLGLDHDNDGHLDVNSTEADSHFKESKTKWEGGEKPAKKVKCILQETPSSKSHNKIDLNDYNKTDSLDSNLSTAIAFIGNEEKMNEDLYNNLYNYHDTNNSIKINQFKAIATKNKAKNVILIKDLLTRYTLDENNTAISNISGTYTSNEIQTTYTNLYSIGDDNTTNALKSGCMAEVTLINDLTKYITLANDSNATDIEEIFKGLQTQSYHNYWSFDSALKVENITNGCYFEGDSLLTDKSELYPQDIKITNTHNKHSK